MIKLFYLIFVIQFLSIQSLYSQEIVIQTSPKSQISNNFPDRNFKDVCWDEFYLMNPGQQYFSENNQSISQSKTINKFELKAENTGLSYQEIESVKTEINNQIDSLNRAFELVDPDKVFQLFDHTGELSVATQGTIFENPDDVLDTLRIHLAPMLKQSITTIAVKTFILGKNAAVTSAAFAADFYFKNGFVAKNIPYALTILFIRTGRGWKIVHYHN